MKLLVNLRRLFGNRFYQQYLSLGIAWSEILLWYQSFGKPGEWLNYQHVMRKKQSDTIFILGTGSSVNQYSSEQWEEIGLADSIGINDWIFHDFIPDILMAEIVHSVNYFPEKYYYDLSLILDRYKEHQTLMIYKDGVKGKKNFGQLPPAVQKAFLVLYNPTIPILKIEQIQQALARMACLLKKHDHSKKLLLFRKRATLFSVIELAWLMGYKKIVLCGIDLSNAEYFFDDHRTYYESKGFLLPVYDQHLNGHKTNNVKISEVTISQLITAFDNVILKPEGIQLYIGSKESALAKELPYFWDSRSGEDQ